MCSIAALQHRLATANGLPTSPMSGPLRGGSTWPRSSISSPGAWSVGRVVSRFFCTFVQATASVRMTCDKPNAIAAQNLLSSSRPAPAGRPGEGNGALPERSERRRFNLVIVTPHEALRRLLEICPIQQRAVPAADGRSRRRLFDEPIRQRLGQCRNGELLLVAQDRTNSAQNVSDERRGKSDVSITSNGSTT